MPPKINQNLSPISELRRNFGGQDLDQFWGQNWSSFLAPICAPENASEHAPRNMLALHRKLFSRSQIFEILEPKSGADRCHQIAAARNRVLRSTGLAADARSGC